MLSRPLPWSSSLSFPGLFGPTDSMWAYYITPDINLAPQQVTFLSETRKCSDKRTYLRAAPALGKKPEQAIN
jgi:hypothetical protein